MTASPDELVQHEFSPRVPAKLGDFTVDCEIGRGATSIVYRVSRDGRAYALKMMLADGPGQTASELSLRFRREAAVVGRLNHPSLPKIVELGESAGRPYLVTEYAPGQPLNSMIESGILSECVVLDIARQLSGALSEVHRFGLIHRDIKPANIVVGDDGRATLLDFGLAMDTLRELDRDEDVVVGTLSYAAPEQAGVIDRDVDARSDLYGLGATIYEALSGRVVFQAPSVNELLQLLATSRPRELRVVRPDVRPALSAIVMKLLAKDPNDRYQSAAGLQWDLDHLAEIEQAGGAKSSFQLGTHDSSVVISKEIPFTGRAAELAAIQTTWSEAQGGNLRLIQVEGESGLGKTRLVRELLASVRAAQGLVLNGKCQESEKVPLGPLREGIDSLLTDIARRPEKEKAAAVDRLHRAAGDNGAIVKRLSRDLARILGDVPEPRPLEPQAELTRFFDCVAEFYRNLATEWGAMVLVVDDVQWIDAGSLEVLKRFCAQSKPTPLLIATTARNDPQSEAALAHFVSTVRTENMRRIQLKPLDSAMVGQMAATFLGGPIDPAALTRLSQLTRGNPFVIGEYVRELVDRGLVSPGAKYWRIADEGLSEDVLPRDVIRVVIRRMDGLSEQARSIVSTAAVIGNQVTLELLARVAALRPDVVRTALEEALRATLMERIAADGYAFVHDKIREAASERLSSAALPDVHQAVADALQQEPSDSSEYLYAVARHSRLGHPGRTPERTFSACLSACERAVDSMDFETSYEFGHGALAAISSNVPEHLRMRLFEALGRACMETGRLGEATRHLEHASEFAVGQWDRFRIQVLLTRTHASRGLSAWTSFDLALGVLGKAMPRSGIVRFLSFVYYLVALALRSITGWGYGRASGKEREYRRRLSDAYRIGITLAVFDYDKERLIQLALRSAHNVHFLGTDEETILSNGATAAVFAAMGLKRATVRKMTAAFEMARQLGNPALQAYAAAQSAMLLSWLGDVDTERMRSSSLELCKRWPGSWASAMFASAAFFGTAALGRTRRATDFLRDALAYVDRANCVVFSVLFRSTGYWQCVKAGRLEEAQKLLAEEEALIRTQAAENTVKYLAVNRCVCRLLADMEQEEFGVEFEESAQRLFALGVPRDLYVSMGRIAVMYGRLAQYRECKKDDGERGKARRRCERMVRTNLRTCSQPQLRCHCLAVQAALTLEIGKVKQARELLTEAWLLARRVDSRWGACAVALERARLAAACSDPDETRAFAALACEISLEEGWHTQGERIAREFGLRRPTDAMADTTAISRGSQAVFTEAISGVSLRGSSYLDALLEVSLASSSTLNPEEQAAGALKELSRVLAAERAMLFIVDPKSGELNCAAVQGVNERDAARLEGYSSTIVRRVHDTGEAVVVSGTEQAALLGSESAVVHDLRSIIAAPLLLRDKVVGVVYLDNRLARGFFTAEHVRILQGISNHIAIAFEMAQVARMESETRELHRDLELTGSVQTLLLPTRQSFENATFRAQTLFQPAAKCGGDWWWLDEPRADEVCVVLGDVTGHGAPAAMITAAVAGSYHTARATGIVDTERILVELNRRLLAWGGEYHMTMCAVLANTVEGTMTCWSAGCPPVLVWRDHEEAVKAIHAPGNPLGFGSKLCAGVSPITLARGDRVLLFSDGLSEHPTRQGRPLGMRNLAAMLAETAGKPLSDACAHIAGRTATISDGVAQDDDVTFVLMERA